MEQLVQLEEHHHLDLGLRAQVEMGALVALLVHLLAEQQALLLDMVLQAH
jgi:hypothetical protein